MKTTTSCTDCGERITEAPLNHAEYGRALCPACRYHSAPAKSQAIEFDDPAFVRAVAGYAQPPAEERDEATVWKAEFLVRWIEWIGTNKSSRQREAIAAHVLGKSGARTDTELAEKLNISAARVSQIRADFIGRFGIVGNCNARQK